MLFSKHADFILRGMGLGDNVQRWGAGELPEHRRRADVDVLRHRGRTRNVRVEHARVPRDGVVPRHPRRVRLPHGSADIERFAERAFPQGVEDAWCVDAGLGYEGSPATNFTGADHLAGMTVTGLADGSVITPFVMPANGEFTLAPPANSLPH